MEWFPLDVERRYSYARRYSDKPGGHKGTDIFAARGTDVLACAAGVACRAIDPKGGMVVYLTADTGQRYYYAHLQDWAKLDAVRELPWCPATAKVFPGKLLGHVGTSGNAKGTSPHLHFQMRDARGKQVDPYDALVAVDPMKITPQPDVPDQPWVRPGERRGPADVARRRGTAGDALGLGALALVVLGIWYLMGGSRG